MYNIIFQSGLDITISQFSPILSTLVHLKASQVIALCHDDTTTPMITACTQYIGLSWRLLPCIPAMITDEPKHRKQDENMVEICGAQKGDKTQG